MITISTTRRPGQAPTRTAGTLLLASVDVEWTKNYRIRNGNVPFCYSIAYLAVPTRGSGTVDLAGLPFQVTSRYVEDADETGALVTAAAAEISDALARAQLVVGHQLSSDLAVLQAAGVVRGVPPTCAAQVQLARDLWRARRQPTRPAHTAKVVDTRYDADHVLTGSSRRLVDVCADLTLDVTQPELRGTSMTAVHRRWLDHRDHEARERVTVLNLRHSLSAALVAFTSTGMAPRQPVAVNGMLARHLPADLGWLQHPAFTATLAS
jgi:hypothetical protein